MSLLQLAGGLAVAGVVTAGATAVTGSGTVWGGSAGGTATQWVGGTVTQTVTGTSITDVAYSFADTAKTQTNQIVITASGADGKNLTVSPTGGTIGGSNGDGAGDEWGCSGSGVTSAYDASAPYAVTIVIPVGGVVTCKTSNSTNHLITTTYYSGLSGLGLTIA